MSILRAVWPGNTDLVKCTDATASSQRSNLYDILGARRHMTSALGCHFSFVLHLGTALPDLDLHLWGWLSLTRGAVNQTQPLSSASSPLTLYCHSSGLLVRVQLSHLRLSAPCLWMSTPPQSCPLAPEVRMQ